MNYIYIFIVLLFLFLVGFLKTKKILNPLSVIGTMWLSLLAISLQGLGDMFTPSNKTVYLVLGACISMTIGAMIATPKRKVNNEIVMHRKKLLNILFLFFCILPIGFALLNFLYIVFTKGYIYYVYLTRIDGVDRAISAGSSFNGMFLGKLTRPVLYFYTFMGMAIFIKYGEKQMIIRSLFCMLAISIIFTSRADMLVLFVTFGLYILSEIGISKDKNKFVRKLNKKQLIVFFVLMLSVLVSLSLRRAGGKEIYDLFVHYVINYHTVGFVLFDISYNNNDSFFYSLSSYGLVSFSSIGFVFQQLDKVLGLGAVIPGVEFREYASLPVSVGTFVGKDYELNAFYTFMAPVFTDFGILGILFFPLVYGYFLMRSYQTYKTRGELYSLATMLFLLWTGYNSLLQSALSTDYYWFICLLFILFNRVKFYEK